MKKHVNKLVHVGIAVKDLAQSVKVFSALFGRAPAHIETVGDQEVKVAFFELGDTAVELTEPTSPASPVTKFIARRGEGVHHLSFEVEDLSAELRRLQAEGFELIDREPRRGAGGCWIAFIHPRSTNGVLVELSQKIRPPGSESGLPG